MKKLSLFVVPIMAASFLIGCGGGGGKPKEPKFSIIDVDVTSSKVVKAKIDWTPSGDSIILSNFEYYTPMTSVTATVEQTGKEGDRPCEVAITFDNEITEDIDGALRFNYDDTTSGVKAVGESIPFTIHVPDPYQVTEDEFNAAMLFEGVEYLQVSDGTSEYKFSPDAYFEKPGNSNAETYIFKESDKYNRYFSQDPSKDGFILIEDAGDSGYYTPQSFALSQEGPSGIIQGLYGLSFGDFTYDETSNTYIATHQPSGGTVFTLKFENKRIVSMDIVYPDPGNDGQSFTYAYEEETLTAPENIQEFDELTLSETADPTTINVVNGRIYIDFTNAGEKLTSSTHLSVQCFMEGEDFSTEVPDQEAYNLVHGYWKGGTAIPNYSDDVDANKQLWDFASEDIEGDFYLTIVLNENFVAPKTGRTMKKDFTGEISCSLNGSDSVYSICINFKEITTEPTTL